MFTEHRTHTHCTGHRPIRLVLYGTVKLIWSLSGAVQELDCSQTFMVSWVTFLGLTLILFATGRKFWLVVKTPTLPLCCITLRFCFWAIAKAQGTHKPVLCKCSMKNCGCKSTWGQLVSMWDGSWRTKAQSFNSHFWEAMSELPWDPHGDAVPGLCSPVILPMLYPFAPFPFLTLDFWRHLPNQSPAPKSFPQALLSGKANLFVDGRKEQLVPLLSFPQHPSIIL